jgi:hypothetical protein
VAEQLRNPNRSLSIEDSWKLSRQRPVAVRGGTTGGRMPVLQPIVSVVLVSLCIAACGDRGWPDPGHGKPPPKPHKDAGASEASASDANTSDASASDAAEPRDSGADALSFPDCLPPCLRELWNKLDACLPVLDRCTIEPDPADAAEWATTTICAPEAGFRYENELVAREFTDTIVYDSVTCYRKTTTWGTGVGSMTRWFDATGTQVAYSVNFLSSGPPNPGIGVVCSSGGVNPNDIAYLLPKDCVIPTDRCQSKTPGRCPTNGDF